MEDILVALILDEKIQGKIDQVTSRLELDVQYVAFFPLGASLTSVRHSKPLEAKRYATLDKWAAQLVSLQNVMITKSATMSGGSERGDRGAAMASWSAPGGKADFWD